MFFFRSETVVLLLIVCCTHSVNISQVCIFLTCTSCMVMFINRCVSCVQCGLVVTVPVTVYIPLQHTPYALLYILNFLSLNFRLMYSTKLNISLPHMTMAGMSNVSVHKKDQ